ncbi:MAG: hypothetical protein WCJ64_01875 [Rhodospirillaceae bacterium]
MAQKIKITLTATATAMIYEYMQYIFRNEAGNSVCSKTGKICNREHFLDFEICGIELSSFMYIEGNNYSDMHSYFLVCDNKNNHDNANMLFLVKNDKKFSGFALVDDRCKVNDIITLVLKQYAVEVMPYNQPFES